MIFSYDDDNDDDDNNDDNDDDNDDDDDDDNNDENDDDLDQTDRETLTRRIREILHQCYKFGFEVVFFLFFAYKFHKCLILLVLSVLQIWL